MTINAFPVVGIGASAGGVEALTTLFKRLPPQPHAAIVVVTHLAPKRESLLPEILARCTTMPVATAEDGQAVEPGHVYLIPPGRILTVAAGRLALHDRDSERNPIDIFLASLAKESDGRMVAVILSGTGNDGAIGVKAVRAAGGLTLAQATDPSTSGHPEMPDAAIATGYVDCVLPVQRLADRIAAYVDGFSATEEAYREVERRGSDAFGQARRDIVGVLKSRVGHDFTHYKDKTFFRRVERRMHVHQIADIADYVRLIESDPDEAVMPGGFLFLGASEGLTQRDELFTPLDKKRRIFQRSDNPGRLPVLPQLARLASVPQPSPRAPQPGMPAGKDALRDVGRRVLEQYAPAHVVVSRDGEVVYFSVRTGKYVEPPAGSPSRNLISLARRGLRLPLRSALQQAADSGRRVDSAGVIFEAEGGQQTVDLTVEPLPEGDGAPLWLVVFTDVGPARSRDGAEPQSPIGGSDAAVLQLEQELQQTRDQLQNSQEEYETSVEELKSANEELLSVNEELQSANEELETSKEELQSVNEELSTVNSEMAAKVEELDRTNSDLRNLFESTRIATIFLDRDFIIRNFTPAMTDVFKLIPGDRGRPLSDIVSLIDCDDLEADVRRALATPTAIEKNVSRRDGTAHFLMRMVPYVASDSRIEGVIVTFVNVTEMVRAEERQALLVAELNHRVKNILAVVASMTVQLARRCTTIGEFADGLINRIQGLAKTHEVLSAKEWSDIALGELLSAEFAAFVGTRGRDNRVSLGGPVVRLRPRAATTLGIVFHELATNALKYGALSVTGGRLAVAWRLEGRTLLLTWREEGGPPVVPPKKKGLGSELIERSLDFELGGKASLDYRPEDVEATLSIPASDSNLHVEEEPLT